MKFISRTPSGNLPSLFTYARTEHQMLPSYFTGLGTTKSGNSISSHHSLSPTEKPTGSTGTRHYISRKNSRFFRQLLLRGYRCKTCPILVTTNTFSSSVAGEHFKLKLRTSCKTSNIIYLIHCRRCGLQYVGETGQPLHNRMNGHRFNIAHGRINESPVAAHFTSEGHGESESDPSVMILDRCWKEDTILRKIRGSIWVRTLDTAWPSEMNYRTDGL